MLLSIFALVLVLLTGVLVWISKGFFSAFLHLLCTVAAGAIAFAAWEPVAYWLLLKGGTGWVGSAAWGLALGVPFGVALIVLRVIVDQTLRANVQVAPIVDMIGGAACGVAAGVIAAGIFMLSVGMLRGSTDSMGAVRLTYGNNGEIKRDSSIWFPADKVVEGMYGHLSLTTFRTGTPLAYQYPDLAEVPSGLRMNYGEGRSRNNLRPTDFTVLKRFTVGGQNVALDSLLADRWNPVPQRVFDTKGERPQPNSRIEGFVVKFNAGAKERGDGKVSVGAGQMRLVIGKVDPADAERYEDVQSVYPIAAACQAEAATPQAARFRYDGRDVYLAGVGGASEATFAFEFVVPQDYQPLALYVKNARVEIEGPLATPVKFASGAMRDAAIGNGSLLGALGGGGGGGGGGSTAGGTSPIGETLDSSQAERIGQGTGWREAPPGFVFNNLLPFTLQLGEHGSLEVDEESQNTITYGMQAFTPEQTKRIITERKLRVQKLATTPDTVTVFVDVGMQAKTSILGQAAATAELVVPPLLRDANGGIYEPVGYVYQDALKVVVRFKPGEPIRSLSQLSQDGVMISRSRQDQKLQLIFRVNKGVAVQSFTLGPKVIAELNPPYMPL